METRSKNIDVDRLIRQIDKGRYNFEFAIQREVGQWNKEQESLLIDTILKGLIIPAIWVVNTNGENANEKNLVIDGRQRCDIIYRYVHNDFKLHKSIEPVVIADDDTGEVFEYEVANKKFEQLDKAVQERIMDYSLSVLQIFKCTDDEIEEQFYRLNNGATFTKPQKARVILGSEIARKLDDEICSHSFWDRASFSNVQRKHDEILSCVLQCLMLMMNFDFKNFNASEVIRFAEYFSKNYDEEMIKELKSRLDILDVVYDEGDENFLKKVNIPAMVMNVDTYNKNSSIIEIDEYANFIVNFVDESLEISGYAENCGAGSTRVSKINNRIAILNEWLQAIIDNKIKGGGQNGMEEC